MFAIHTISRSAATISLLLAMGFAGAKPNEARKQEIQAAVQAAKAATVTGPSDIKLAGQAVLAGAGAIAVVTTFLKRKGKDAA